MLAIQPAQQSMEAAPSSSLEETEPLTAYLHRPRPQSIGIQQGQPSSPTEKRQQHISPVQMQQYSPVYPHYIRRYSPHPRQQQQQQQEQQHTSIDQQKKHDIGSKPPFPSRQMVPFPMPPSDISAGQSPSLHAHSPAPGTPCASQTPKIQTLSSLHQQSLQKQTTQQHNLASHSLASDSLTRAGGRRMSSTLRPPYINTFVSQDQPATAVQLQQQQQQKPGSSESISYRLQPASASTDTSSPRKTRASPTSPFSGPYQLPVSSIADVMQSPSMQQRARGPSITSTSSTATASHTGTSSSRRRASRAEPRSPYSRPAAIPQSPHSPQSPQSPISSQSPRRTYRRHPKKDPNAPEKWRSAYQLFRDDVNRELHGQDIPFSDMSKIHSKRWAELSEDLRVKYFEQSNRDKEEYLRKMAAYEQTLEYKYLHNFYKQDSTVNRVGRPKGTRSSASKGKDPTNKGYVASSHSRSQSMVVVQPDRAMRDTPTSSMSPSSPQQSREHTPKYQR
ncbi:hypothetical protein LPJ74_001433 [Coemansia sp. RSA 1843]|nr:hypothetical protein LPJ74_001433 [Coemansia sp. RSA 1843]